MKAYVTSLRHNIEINIQEIESSENNSLSRIKKIISCLHEKLTQLKSFIVSYEFKTKEEEIHFFKELKPQIYGRLLFYIRLFKIEKNRPGATIMADQIYLSKEMKKLEEAFTNCLDFYKYYRSGNIIYDDRYFLRKAYNPALDKDPSFLEKDLNFSTIYDYEVSNIIANDLLKAYLISQLEELNDSVCFDLLSIVSQKQMKWTNSKVSLVELVYSIHSSKSINHGNIDLKDLIKCFEIIFNVNIGDFYRAFLEIRGRKKSRTRYIDLMRESLIEKMDNLDK